MTAPMRVLVIDDEPLARQRIIDMLRDDASVEVVGQADNGNDAVTTIRDVQPDLVFLDVQMPGRNGLDVVREVGPEHMPLTIFVTAYDKHALQAFEVAAVDYLLKPFDDERFEQALARARRMLELEEVGKLRSRLLEVLQGERGERSAERADAPPPSGEYLERIPVEMRGKVRVVPTSEIEFI
ncbi:MAG TPA: response regulator, partial [Gemmatimonadaceae bacterium]|nr:response regulator [Gemmatimonadaceae bacterium]